MNIGCEASKYGPSLAASIEIEALRASAEIERQPVQPIQQLGQRFPPETMCPLGQALGDEDREGRVVAGKDRQRMVEIVAIAVVEGKGCEGLPVVFTCHPLRQRIEGDEIVAVSFQPGERAIEEFGQNFQMRVRREAAGQRRADMVQREDHAEAGGIAHQPDALQNCGGFQPAGDRGTLETVSDGLLHED